MTTPPFNPIPCGPGTGEGGGFDVESNILCDLDAQGTLLGTALAIWTYDENGNPVGAPTFVDPATGAPYVPQGTLQVCPGGQCAPPMQFCQTSSTTGPVEHAGRMYDLTLPINPGFAVQSLAVDAVTHAAGITWEVDDPDGTAFATALDTFITGRLPSGTTVTVTNPNAGTPQVCGAATPMQIHIECIRLDQSPPNLIELIYNAGQDMVQNPAYNEFPALNPPVAQGNYGFHLLSRQDDPGPFPGNQPSGDALCTTVVNRGWETNDIGRTFEIWGQDITAGENVTPTPRGTPVQEITSDGPPPGGRSTIWQTFTAPASGNFIIRVVHGARDNGEQHRITLDNGDTNDAQNGDLIDDNTNPPSVTGSGGPNPWTQFTQTIPLTSGNTYTLALSTNNPVGGARGGLFTDMRAYIDRPDQRATATTNDDTCVVTTEETTTNTVCSFWQPQCSDGRIVGWVKIDTGLTLTNAQFWAQTPTPACCTAEVQPGSGGSSLSNMIISDIVCATVGGVSRNAIRVVVTDPSGGQLQETFLGQDGAPVAPDSWTAGPCSSDRAISDLVLCDAGTPGPDGGPTPFLRKFVQSLSDTGQGQVNGHRDFTLDGTSTFAPVGPVGACVGPVVDQEVVCWTQTSTGTAVHTGTMRHDDRLPAPGWLLFDQHQTLVSPAEPGLTFVSCSGRDSETFILCDSAAVPVRFLRTYTYTSAGAVAGFTDTTFAGAAFVPTGAVGVCATTVQTDFDFDQVILCDANGTSFIRRFTFNSQTGAVTATTNLTLAGAAFTPVGAVGLCSDCCPQVIGEGCSNTGSGRYTAIRAVNGTVTLIDSVSGAAITAGNIIPCSEVTTLTLTSQGRLVADADAAWTPGADVVGTLTSVTFTVLSGTATVTDQSGTVLTGLPAGYTATWTAADNHTLSGPQSIDAVGGNTAVVWTQR